VYYFVRERALFAGFGAAMAHLNWYWTVAAFAAELASVPPLADARGWCWPPAASRPADSR
jgi:hypothetical protein